MTQYGFYVNTDICIGCKACMTSCFDRNDLEVPQKFRTVFEFGGGAWETDADGAFINTVFCYYVSVTCGQCESPSCVEACLRTPCGRIRRRALWTTTRVRALAACPAKRPALMGHPARMADGLSHKCVMCADLAEGGVPDPTCVKACPVRAIEFGPSRICARRTAKLTRWVS